MVESTPKPIHNHIPHTVGAWLSYCCHGNPIKGGHSGYNSGEISSSPCYLLHTHTHSFLSLAAISICLPPLLSSAHPLSFSSSPCITLGIPHRPSPTITAQSFHHFITSHFQVKCKYVSSHFKPLWCLCLWLLFVSTHILCRPLLISVCLSPMHLSSETADTFVSEAVPLFWCPLQLKGRFTRGISQRPAWKDSFNKGLHAAPLSFSCSHSLAGRWLAT